LTVPILFASAQSQLHALIAVLVFGFAIGVIGHIIASRTLILTSIIIIGLLSAYFGFVLHGPPWH
jgi:hypothetical protein